MNKYNRALQEHKKRTQDLAQRIGARFGREMPPVGIEPLSVLHQKLKE
jgi:hypothetical protein